MTTASRLPGWHKVPVDSPQCLPVLSLQTVPNPLRGGGNSNVRLSACTMPIQDLLSAAFCLDSIVGLPSAWEALKCLVAIRQVGDFLFAMVYQLWLIVLSKRRCYCCQKGRGRGAVALTGDVNGGRSDGNRKGTVKGVHAQERSVAGYLQGLRSEKAALLAQDVVGQNSEGRYCREIRQLLEISGEVPARTQPLSRPTLGWHARLLGQGSHGKQSC